MGPVFERGEGRVKITKDFKGDCNLGERNNDDSLHKTVIVYISPNHRIVTVVHSKTVKQNRLRMCVIKKKSFFLITKISPRDILRQFRITVLKYVS